MYDCFDKIAVTENDCILSLISNFSFGIDTENLSRVELLKNSHLPKNKLFSTILN